MTRRVLLPLALSLLVAPAALVAQGAPLTLRPGDLIDLKILPEAALGGGFGVDERGVVTLPILGARQVAGQPWGAVRDSIVAGYRRELRDPVITLTPLRRLSVLGSVNKAGIYLVDPTLPLAGAIALAEGATEDGDLNRVRLVRDGRTILARVPVERLLVDADVRSGDQLFVDRRGWWDLNSGQVVAAAISAIAIAITILSR